MITVNNEMAQIEQFPDGTPRIKQQPLQGRVDITWKYHSEAELFQLYALVRHIQKTTDDIHLYIPYIPNARMDRVKNTDEVFTLKAFAEILNMLKVKEIKSLDVHSATSSQEICNLQEESPIAYIEESVKRAGCSMEEVIFYFPDKGARDRYRNMLQTDKICYGEKVRDWRSGKIQGLEIQDIPEGGLGNRPVFMIDDICSYGGTLYYSALKLKELGADRIYSFTTHTENSIVDEQKGSYRKLLLDGTVSGHYTTDSIFSEKYDHIEVLSL